MEGVGNGMGGWLSLDSFQYSKGERGVNQSTSITIRSRISIFLRDF